MWSEKGHFPDTYWKDNETVKRDYNYQPSELEEGPSDLVSQKAVSLKPVPEAPIIIVQNNEGESKRVSILVIENADLSLRVAKRGY